MNVFYRTKHFAVVALVLAGGALAQDTGVKRTVLQRTDVAIGVPQEGVMGTAVLPPGASIGAHTHLGVEMGYVLEGELDLIVAGEAVRRVKAGDTFVVPAGKVHDAKSVGTGQGKVLAVWVVEKGKPLAEPAK